MGTVTYLPRNVRSVTAMHQAVRERAQRVRAPESKFLHAFGVGLKLMLESDASSAWATQAGWQELRDAARMPRFGGEAA